MAVSDLLRVGSECSRRGPRRFPAAAALTLLASLAVPGLLGADPTSPFTIANADSPDPVASGSQLTYTITIVNTGGAKVDQRRALRSAERRGRHRRAAAARQLTSSRGSCTQNGNARHLHRRHDRRRRHLGRHHPRHRHRRRTARPSTTPPP